MTVDSRLKMIKKMKNKFMMKIKMERIKVISTTDLQNLRKIGILGYKNRIIFTAIVKAMLELQCKPIGGLTLHDKK